MRNSLYLDLKPSEASIRGLLSESLQEVATLNSEEDYRRFERLLDAVVQARRQAWANAYESFRAELTNFVLSELDRLRKIVFRASPVKINFKLVNPDLVRTLPGRSLLTGRTATQWFEDTAQADIKRISSEIQRSVVSRRSLQQLFRNLFGTQKAKQQDGLVQKTYIQIQNMTRHVVRGLGAEVKRIWVAHNKFLFTVERYTTLLDGGTTAVCRAKSNELYKIGDGDQPPLHFGCRSMRIPSFNGRFLATLTPKYGVGTEDVMELVGPVFEPVGYAAWLKAQSPEFQNEILGKRKASLFREGELELSSFVQPNGRELTLAELEELY